MQFQSAGASGDHGDPVEDEMPEAVQPPPSKKFRYLASILFEKKEQAASRSTTPTLIQSKMNSHYTKRVSSISVKKWIPCNFGLRMRVLTLYLHHWPLIFSQSWHQVPLLNECSRQLVWFLLDGEIDCQIESWRGK